MNENLLSLLFQRNYLKNSFIKLDLVTVKAMLHEAIFLATCNATNVAFQVAGKNSRITTHFATANCCVASCKKSRTTLYFLERCETSRLRVISPQQQRRLLSTHARKKSKSFLFRPFRACIAGSAVFGAAEFVNPTFERDSFLNSSSVSHVKHVTVKSISK